jgi:hypothetical protein
VREERNHRGVTVWRKAGIKADRWEVTAKMTIKWDFQTQKLITSCHLGKRKTT